jgi:cell division protein FtsB
VTANAAAAQSGVVSGNRRAGGAGDRRRRRRVWVLLGVISVLAFLFLAVFPTRTYLEQRSATQRAEERRRVLQEQNELLQERVALLGTDEEIERLAREDYNLVRPGEEAYAVLPPPPPPLDLPDGWPFDRLEHRLRTQTP